MTVRIGLLLPTREAALPGQWNPRQLVHLARHAARCGFRSVWTGDSLLATPRLEPLTLLSAIATATSTITVGAAALLAPLRHPLRRGTPLWYAGAGPRGLRMTGELFDGWLPYLPSTQHYRAGRAAIAKASIAAGRDPSTVTSALYLTVNVNDDADRARAELAEYTQAYHRQPLTPSKSSKPSSTGRPRSSARTWLRTSKPAPNTSSSGLARSATPPADRAARRHPDARYALVTQPEACNGSGIPPH